MLCLWRSRKGNEMVEAALILPVIVLITVLILRLFTFYIEVLTTQVHVHERAMDAWSVADTAVIDTYHDAESVYMLTGGLLPFEPHARIEAKAYLFNEDRIVRLEALTHDQ